MEKFEWKNAQGKKLTFDYSGKCLIDSYSGLTAADIQPVNIKGYRQHGYTLEYITFGSRIISINFLIHEKTPEDIYRLRRELAAIFNPALGEGTLTYTNNYLSKSISGFCSILPTPTARYGLAMMMNVEITCPNPFWYDTAQTTINLDGFEKGLTFPFKFDEGVQFSHVGDRYTVNIEGDVGTPIKAVFRGNAERPTVNPILRKIDTKEYIKVLTTLDGGEKLTITTDYGNKDVILTTSSGANHSAYNLIDVNSSFFYLTPGANILTFTSEGGIPSVDISYRNLYAGV